MTAPTTVTPTEAGAGQPQLGRSIPARGSAALASGRGTFVNDIVLPRTTYLAVLRSPYPHARIRSIDACAALARPGVLRVLTGETVRERTRPIPMGAGPNRDGRAGRSMVGRRAGARALRRARPSRRSCRGSLDRERGARRCRRRLRGAADDRGCPRRARAGIAAGGGRLGRQRDVPTRPSGDRRSRRRHGSGSTDRPRNACAPAGSPACPSNRAERSPRGIPTPKLTTWDATQQPHVLRTFLAESLRLPETSVRVIQPAVGGAFGLKQPLYQEQVLCGWASIELGRPVKWIEQRAESFLAGGHARDTRFEYEVGFTPEGRCRRCASRPSPTSARRRRCSAGRCRSCRCTACRAVRRPRRARPADVVVTNKCPGTPTAASARMPRRF